MSTAEISTKYQGVERARYLLRKTVDELAVDLEQAKENLDSAAEASSLLQEVSKHLQETVHRKIASVVSRCLRSVFDDPYDFEVIFENKRGRTEAQLRFSRRGFTVDPMSACGGGVVDVAAFALRLACLCIMRPRKRMVVVLDEPFRFLSAGYRSRARALIEVLAEELGVQFIMVTHIEELQTGAVVEIGV